MFSAMVEEEEAVVQSRFGVEVGGREGKGQFWFERARAFYMAASVMTKTREGSLSPSEWW